MSQAHENLYDSLGYNISTDDLSTQEKEELMELIPKLDQETKEMIYLLTLYDYTKSNPGTKVIFPYKMKQVSTNRLEIKLDTLPVRLKRILYRFCTLAKDKDSPVF